MISGQFATNASFLALRNGTTNVFNRRLQHSLEEYKHHDSIIPAPLRLEHNTFNTILPHENSSFELG